MRILLLIVWVLIIGCSEVHKNNNDDNQGKESYKIESIVADSDFDGARLNDFRKLNDSTYQVFINPENTPINNSPWYCFRIWSEKEVKITLEFIYPEGYEHRYIPKLSYDGIEWKSCEEHLFKIDRVSGNFTLDLFLTPKKLWISSQENLNTEYINVWVDSLTKLDFIDKEEVGKSVLGKPITLFRINKDKKTAKSSIIILGRQHPPEVPGGTISLMSFVSTLLSDSDLANDFRDKFEILVFPLLNPDGVTNGNWRHNANSKDLNRDWVSFSEPETQSVRDWLLNARNRGLEYSFGIDFHTSYSGPYLLTLDTIPHLVKPEITNKWINQLKTKDSVVVKPRAQSLPYCYNWMINELGIEAVTYEEGDEINRKIVKNRAMNYANELMKVLLEKYD